MVRGTATAAAAAVVGFAGLLPNAFVSPVPVRQLHKGQSMGRSLEPPTVETPLFEGTPSESGALRGCLSVGLVAGAVGIACRRPKIARKYAGLPIAEYKEQSGFAGGLVGSEYGGYGRHEYDPMELASRYPEHLPWYREAELKHGRIAMLAFLGLLVPDAIRIPLDVFDNADITLVNAHNKLIGKNYIGEGPMWWLLIFCSVIESLRFKQLGLAYENLTLENAGDLNFGKGFLPVQPEGVVALKVKELKNGRLAMLAFSGAITQAVMYDAPHFPFLPN